MVNSSVPVAALAACALFGSTVATHHVGIVNLEPRDLTTVTVTVTTCPQAGASYPAGSVASSAPVETPGTPYGAPPATTTAEIPPPYSAPSVATSVKTTSTVVPPAVPTTSETETVKTGTTSNAASETTSVKTETTSTNVETTPATSTAEVSTSTIHTSATHSATTSIPPAVGVAGKDNVHMGALMALVIAAIGASI